MPTAQYGFNWAHCCTTSIDHNSQKKSNRTSPSEASIHRKPSGEAIQASSHMWVRWIDSFGVQYPLWLAGHDAENEGAGRWSARYGILPNFRVVGPPSPN